MLWNNCIIFVDKLVKYNFDPLLAKLETMLNIWETLKNMLRGNLSFIVMHMCGLSVALFPIGYACYHFIDKRLRMIEYTYRVMQMNYFPLRKL